MQVETKSKLKPLVRALSVGLGIFVVSEVLGNIVGALFLTPYSESMDFYLPVPYHFHGIVFALAFVFTAFCFRTMLYQRLERSVVLTTLFIGYFVIFPIAWVYATSHGNLSLVILNLSNLPQVLVNANTFVEDENVLEISTEFGIYRYRSYFDRKIAEYVYEVWKDGEIAYTESVYSFTRRCLKSTSGICLYVTIPYTVVDLNLGTVEVDYQCAVINDPKRIKDINNDQIVDLVVHIYPGNGKEIYFKVFSLGKELKVETLPASEPVFAVGGC